MNKKQITLIDSQKIPREEYLERLRNLKHKKLIKIVTGIRRCGKSTVLEMFRDELLNNGVEENQIIFINFEDYENLCKKEIKMALAFLLHLHWHNNVEIISFWNRF